jgi:hypothetical protein
MAAEACFCMERWNFCILLFYARVASGFKILMKIARRSGNDGKDIN